MTIAFYSVLLNHHQVHIADELYSILGNDYVFVELNQLSEPKGGSDYSQRPYLIKAWQSGSAREEALRWAKTADVCVFGGYPAMDFLKERMKYNLLSFDMSERWLKLGVASLFSPRILKQVWYYYTKGRTKPLYKLCCSAFAAADQRILFTFKDRCYKWGYFTNVENVDADSAICLEKLMHNRNGSSTTKIMWCGRFLKWKHPELPIQMARKLNKQGIPLKLDMYGDGDELEKMRELTYRWGLSELVEFKGYHNNDFIKKSMKEHDIFLFTSDRYEGWGVVLNEAMSNGCAVIASDEIGAAPYLIDDGINGLLFKSRCVDSLCEKVQLLINHPIKRLEMGKNAYLTIRELWSPKHAVFNFLTLSSELLKGQETTISQGPCSIA